MLLRRLALLSPLALSACVMALPGPAPQPAPAPAPGGYVSAFAARGNEPFWAVDTAETATGATMKISTPQLPNGVTLPATRSAFASGVEFTATLAGRPVTLTIVDGPCADTMSGQQFEFKAGLNVNGQLNQGCASRR